ncbi:MAG: AAA-like domain-containing protein [Prochlorotrichaceae cyanobacterium]
MTYQIGGSLPENATTYVLRQADEILYRSLLGGEFCAVLNARQMGKSSLVVQTIKRLRQEGIACVALDLSDLGSQQVSLEQWYGGVAFKILSGLQLFDIQEFVSWWQTYQDLAPVQRLAKLFDEVILSRISGQLVLFIDEIDSVLSFQEPLDDFFSWIRSCYNQRSLNPAYQRLSFTLLGVATPSDLIQDPQRTPFNIGIAIDLQPLNLTEASPLAQGFNLSNPALAQEILAEILTWTGGQPFLTQKLCAIVSAILAPAPELAEREGNPEDGNRVEETLAEENLQQWVTAIVQDHLLDHWETQDEPIHLRTIRNRLLRHAQQGNRLLTLYDRLLQGDKIALDNSLEQSQLRLSGIVRSRNGTLQVYNPIYAHIFSPEWIESVLQSLRPYAENFQAWIHSNQTDESRLLRGQALLYALAWAVNKHLSALDYQFLAASRDLVLQESQHREAEGQRQIERLNREKELLEQLAQEQEQRRFAELQLRRQQWQRRVSVTGSIASMLAFLCGVIWMHLNTQTLTLRLNRWLELGEQMLTIGEPTIALWYGLEAARARQGAVGLETKVELRLWTLLDRSQRSLTPLGSPSETNPELTLDSKSELALGQKAPSEPSGQSLVITPNGEVQRWIKGKLRQSIAVRRTPLRHPSLFTIVSSPDPQQFLLQNQSAPAVVEMWHFRDGLQGYLLHDRPVLTFAWSQDAKLLATLTVGSSPDPEPSEEDATDPQLYLWYQDFSLVTQFPVSSLRTIAPETINLSFTEGSTILDFQLEYTQGTQDFIPLLRVNPRHTLQQVCQRMQQSNGSPPNSGPSAMPLPDRQRSIQRFCHSR